MGNDAIGAVQGPATTRVNKVALSLHDIYIGAAEGTYSRLGYVTTAEKTTLEGFGYIEPGFGDGFNGFTAGLNCLEANNGALNSHCKYQMDENGELVPPTHTMMFMG